MPYGEYFLPVLKYIITYQTETTCKLNISVGIRWSKSPNYIIKSKYNYIYLILEKFYIV